MGEMGEGALDFWRLLLWLGAAPFKLVFGGKRGREDKPHGNARWAEHDDLEKATHFDPQDSFFVGWWEGEYRFRKRRKRVFTHKDRSVVVVGPPGIGKSQTLISNIKVIKTWRGPKPDLLVSDPANGELLAATQQDLEKMGYRIISLNLVSPDQSHRYDPLTYLKPRERGFSRRVAMFCESIIPPVTGDPKSEHFADVPRLFLAAIVSHCMEHLTWHCTLPFLLGEAIKVRGKDDRLLEAMRNSTNDVVKIGMAAYDQIGREERGSVTTSMARRFLPLMYEDVIQLCTPEKMAGTVVVERGWGFEEVFKAKEPVAIFIRSGLDGGVSGAYIRMVISNAINTRRMMTEEGYGFQKGLRILTDESKMLGNCTALVNAQDELRKSNARLMLFYLSKSDIFDAFPVGAKTLFGTSDFIVAGGTSDYETTENVSRLMGDKTEYSDSTYFGKGGASGQRSEFSRRLMRPEEVRDIDPDNWLVVLGRLQIVLRKPFLG